MGTLARVSYCFTRWQVPSDPSTGPQLEPQQIAGIAIGYCYQRLNPDFPKNASVRLLSHRRHLGHTSNEIVLELFLHMELFVQQE